METDPKDNLILIVEDSDEDFFATTRAFKKAKLSNPVVRCEDGDEALDYLLQTGRFADKGLSPRPAIVLLDLNLPGTDGREILKEMKDNPELKDIPVIVMTTSSNDWDVNKCYKYGANSYVLKPISFEGYINAVQKLNDYWFNIVLLPKP